MAKKIEFVSEVKQNGEVFNIQFQSPVEMSIQDGFDIYEFKEPKNNVMNRIEINNEQVNIFAGPSSINLDINKEIIIEYRTEHGNIMLVSDMSKMNNKDKHNVAFTYSLSSEGELVGEYAISLKVT